MKQRATATEVLRAHLKERVGRGRDQVGSSAVAKKAGVSAKTITNIINGDVSPQLVTLESLAKYFGMEVWELLLPEHDKSGVHMLRVYRQSSADRGRWLIDIAIEAALSDQELRRSENS